MAYNLRYYGSFYGFYNGVQYEIEINEKDYSGGWEYIEWGGDPDPIIDRIRGSREDVGRVIFGREIEFIIHPPSDDLGKFNHLIYSRYKDFEVIIKKGGSEIFRGWLLPENIEKDFVDTPYEIKLSATDGLAQLKDVPWLDEDQSRFVDNHLSVLMVIHLALEKIGFSVNPDYEIMVNTYETDQMDADSSNQHPNVCPLEEAYINPIRFIKGLGARDGGPTLGGMNLNPERKGGTSIWDTSGNRSEREGRENPERQRQPSPGMQVKSHPELKGVDDCYTVIEKVLQPFNAILRQIDGKWIIENPNELDSQIFLFSGTLTEAGTFEVQSPSPQSIDNKLTLDTEDFEPFGRVERLKPRKSVYTEFMSRKIGERLGSDDSSNLDSWDLNLSDPGWEIDPDYKANENKSTRITVNESSDSKLDVSVDKRADNEADIAINSDWFGINSPEDFNVYSLPTEFDPSTQKVYIKLRLQLKLNSIDTTKTYPPTMRVVIYKPADKDSDREDEGIVWTDHTDSVQDTNLHRYVQSDHFLFFWDEYSYWESPNNDTFVIDKEGDYAIDIFIYNRDYDTVRFTFKGRPDIRIEDSAIESSSRDKRTYQTNDVNGLEGGSVSLAFGDGVFNDEINTFTTYDSDTAQYIRTSGWNRWERQDDIPIIWTYLQQQLNQFRDYVKLVSLGRYDKNDEISPRSILVLPTSESDSAEYYRIVGWQKKYRTGYVKMQLVQMFPSYVYGDVGNPATEYTLDSVDGANQVVAFPGLRALSTQFVNNKLANLVEKEASEGAANKSYTGQNVDNWNGYPDLSGTDKRVGIRIDKTNDRIIIGFLNADDSSSGVSYEAELEIYGAEANNTHTSDTAGTWSGNGDTISLDSSADLATISGNHSSGNDCYTIDYTPNTTSNEVQFRFRITKYDEDSAIATWNISCGDRLFGENVSIPTEFFFTPKDTEEIDALRTTNAPEEAGSNKTENHAKDIIHRQSSAPSNPKDGWIWYDTDDGTLYRYNGSSWEEVADLTSANVPTLQEVTDAGNNTSNSTRITDNNNRPTTGSGMELEYSPTGNTSVIRTFDRNDGTFKDMAINASTINIQKGDVNIVDGKLSMNDKSKVASLGRIVEANWQDDTHYGYIEFNNNSGTRGSYVGYGNGSNDIDFVLDNASRLKFTGGNVGILKDPSEALDVAGNFQLSGNEIMTGGWIGTDNFASETTGWRITYTGQADFRYIFTDELRAQIFTADVEQALAGSDILAKSVTHIAQDFTLPANGNTTTIYVEDLPGAADTAVFEANDYVKIKYYDRNGGLTLLDIWGQVTNYSDETNGQQSWTWTTIDDGGISGTTISDDSVIVDYGVSGDGYIERTTLGSNSPYTQVAVLKDSPDQSDWFDIRMRYGNLSGLTLTNTSNPGYGIVSLEDSDNYSVLRWYSSSDYGMKGVSGGSTVFTLGSTNQIAGWTFTATELKADSGKVGMNSEITAGTDYRFWAGNTTPGSAPFRVDEDGNLTATSGEIGGANIDTNKMWAYNTGGFKLNWLSKEFILYDNNSGDTGENPRYELSLSTTDPSQPIRSSETDSTNQGTQSTAYPSSGAALYDYISGSVTFKNQNTSGIDYEVELEIQGKISGVWTTIETQTYASQPYGVENTYSFEYIEHDYNQLRAVLNITSGDWDITYFHVEQILPKYVLNQRGAHLLGTPMVFGSGMVVNPSADLLSQLRDKQVYLEGDGSGNYNVKAK
jgi:hypothetical protein